MTVIFREPFSTALRDWLKSETAMDGELGQAPKTEDGSDPEVPYFIVYSLPGGGLTGGGQAPEADATWLYQVTCVGSRTDQIEWAMDRVREALLRRQPDGTTALLNVGLGSLRIIDVQQVAFGGSDGIASEIGSGADQYAFAVTSG